MAEEGEKVSLHVYDLSQGLARQFSMSFLGKAIEGIWHTGVVVYGTEYYFGAGIQQTPIGTAPYGAPLRMVELGVTKIPKDEFESYLKELSPRYTAETYNLMKHNCNNFSNEVAQFLVGTNIPEYILNLPNEVLSSPMAPLMMPMIHNLEATLREGSVPQAPQFGPMNKVNGPSQSGKSQPPGGQYVDQQVVDPLGHARSQIQDEIAKEFAAIRAAGTLGPSEAVALATKNVMQKYGFMNATS